MRNPRTLLALVSSATPVLLPFLTLLLAAACGSDAPAGTPTDDGGLGSPDAGAGLATDAALDGPPTYATLLGVWQITGQDARGSYAGELELRDAGGGNADVYRVVHYTGGLTVEDARELWTAWTGTAAVSGLTAEASVSLRRADFVKSRGGVTRAAANLTPLAVAGSVTANASGVLAHWTSASVSADDTLTNLTPSGAKPIFALGRVTTPANNAPPPTTLALWNSLYASFQALPNVAPYANDPAFKAGVYYLEADTTDFEFYAAHPTALRVVNKVVDAPSLGETLARANAYRKTLAQKAAFFDTETPTTFIEPAAGQLVNSVSGGVQLASGDGALWTSAYIASQAFRYLVTHDAAVLPNIAKSADGIQLLMEITPDRTTFARTIRASTGGATGIWHTGLGPFAAYEWMEGGNTDMFKGIFYGTLMAYIALCDPQIAGQQALCARMRVNAQHMLSDLTVAQGTTSTSNLTAAWLTYYLTGSSSALLTALGDWTSQASLISAANYQMQVGATADWSGAHLTFVDMLGLLMLEARMPLPTASTHASIQKGIETMQGSFSPYRLGLWSVLFATKVGTPAQADIDSARWRLREMPAPRAQLDIDHRVGAGFVMAPFPEEGWKNDWTTSDRADSLHGYPLFEQPIDVYAWRSPPWNYLGNLEGTQSPSADYLHAYWLGRYLGLFSATE